MQETPLMHSLVAAMLVTPVLLILFTVTLLFQGQTLGHWIRGYEVVYKGTNITADFTFVLFKYWILTPISHYMLMGLVANGALYYKSRSPDVDTIEDQIIGVEVVYKKDGKKDDNSRHEL